MRCHYVPQFYLKNFTISDESEHIYAYRRKSKPFKTKTRSIVAKNNLYIFKDKKTGKKSDKVERMFSWLEGVVAPIINRIVNQSSFNISSLSNQDKIILSEFIAYLHTRNLSFREQQKNIHSAGIKMMMKFGADNKEFFKREARDLKIIKNDEEIEDLRQSILNFDKHFKIDYGKENDDYFLKNALLLTQRISPAIFYKEWHLLESNNRVFVTSDNPVSLIRPENLPQFRGVGFRNGYIAVPISQYKCLLLVTGKGIIKKKANRENVDFLNGHTMFYAHKFIYSNMALKDIENNFNKTKEGASEKVVIG